MKGMKICVGVLAYNEERGIEATLSDLLAQDLWSAAGEAAELLVVVNGSKDRTAELARARLAEAGIRSRVIEVERPGKANAWNRLIAEFSEPDTEIFFLADADIQLPQPEALREMLETLQAHPESVAVVDVPVKDLAGKVKQGLGTRLSLSASALASAGPPKLCGQLYAARAAALRKIFLPEPMLVEDGFIKAMLVTDGFTRAEDSGRLVRAEKIYHIYEAETKPGSIYKHEKRILIGSLCNFLLFDLARELVKEGEEVGAWMAAQTAADPEWFRKRIQAHLGTGGLPKGIWVMVGAPWGQWKQLHGKARFKALPATLVRTALNLSVALGAAWDLKKGKLYW